MKKRLLGLLACGILIAVLAWTGLETKIQKEKENFMKIENYHTAQLGENVYLFRESDDHAQIQEIIDSVYRKQEANQFGEERIAFCFFPGDYSDITVSVGFYTQVLGLGTRPTDVKIGKLECLARWLGNDPGNHNACCNFWRSVENVELLSNTVWAVSQATDMRRIQVDGALYLHDDYGWCSGGFLSDSKVATMIDSGSQQQWLSRNNRYKAWMNDNWNEVFVGDDPDGTPTGTWPVKAYTEVEKTVEIREKPFLVWTEAEVKSALGIFVPETRMDSVGPSWEEDAETPGNISAITDWYIAQPGTDSAETINAAILEGKNILFTPGIYNLYEPIVVEQDDRMLLGLGLASLRACNGNACIETKGSNLTIAGLLFDAGVAAEKDGKKVSSPNLLYVGEGKDVNISDLYFRVGGTPTNQPATATCCVTLDADHVIGDNLWVWRADHGDQVAWDKNVTKNGIVINGDDTIMYALMVEHFHEYQTVWNGNNGQLYMYQSEVPYDVPGNDVWMSRGGTRYGYASLFVNDDVERFHGEGIGIYLYNRDASVLLESVMEMPDKKGVSVHHILSVMITGNPGVAHVLNEAGGAAMTPGSKAMLIDYEGGEYR
ncbi:MAG: sialidase [Lachnospiraceae bacterium]|nr:sialidase [Lachnospiraceae bacterium]